MYEEQIALINKRIGEFTEKAHLKRRPKLETSKSMVPASADSIFNTLHISEYFLEAWEHGFFNEKDVDALLAHEFGHFIAFQKSRLEAAKIFFIPLYFMLLLGVLGFFRSLQTPEQVIITALITVCWLYFLPWIIRRTYVPSEFEADNNAIAFKLVDARQLADALLKRMSKPQPPMLGPNKTLGLIWLELTHPSVDETVQNLGLEIRSTVEIKRI